MQASSTHPTTQTDVLTNGDHNSTAFWSSGDENAQVNYAETLTIDLGAEKLVGSVWLYPRKTGSRDVFPLDFNINGSTDGQSWKTLRSVKDADIPLSGNPRNFEVSATKVRYLQIQATRLRPMTDDGNLYRMQLSGIEVFPPGR